MICLDTVVSLQQEIYARADTTLKREALEKANPIKDTPAMPQWNDDEGLMEWLRTLI